ncbi:MAG: beta-glucosidase [Acidimicrobiales bacterium]|nr:beta-glucosidase [Acidimicrobiales bacterium]
MTDVTVDELVAALTLDEKAALTAGIDMWHTAPIERLGIPSWKMTDGPNGARGGSFDRMTPSAAVPCGSALGATWNPALLEQIGAVLGDQARTKQARVLLAPTVNLDRHPLGGRTFEAYSEDPLLSGLLAAAFVRGAQAQGVATTVKHLVGNEQETERNTIDTVIDERALRELYLLPFELAVKEGGTLGVMTAYNRLNGPWCDEHAELLGIVRDEWGFDGIIVSDWYAVDSTIGSALAGLDIEMPGPPRQYGPKLAEAVRAGDLDQSVLDAIVRRILGVFDQLGALDDPPVGEEQSVDRPEHRAAARRAAIESTVLLRNDGVLPFDVSSLGSLVVIGPNADRAQIIGGGSATLEPHYRITPLEALRTRLGDVVDITYEQGCDIDRTVPPMPLPMEEVFLDADGNEVFRRSGDNTRLVFFGPPSPELSKRWSVRSAGTFTPEVSGPYQVTLIQAGRARVVVDGQVVVDGVTDPPPPGQALFGMASEQIDGTVELVAGKPVELVIELSNDGAPLVVAAVVGVRPVPPPDLLERAVAAAAAADAVVVVVGTNDDWETEGHDRTSMDLPGGQDELVRRVCAANPRTAVVLNAGSPVTLPWADEAPALLDVWFGGQEMANGLVDVLTGRADPSGRLPMTFPERIEHAPAFGNFPGEHGEVRYGEGVLVGYRWYEARHLPVRFPFGHGLSYTTFELGTPEVSGDEPMLVRVRVTNTGSRSGGEVVQLYVEPVDPKVVRPPKELKAFAKVWLEAGKSATVTLALTERAFAHWSPDPAPYEAIKERQRTSTVSIAPSSGETPPPKGWHVEPGEYRLHVGRSSADIQHIVPVTISAG